MNKFLASLPAPGRRNVLAVLLASLSIPAVAAPADVVISQVYGGGGNSGATYRHDFIEIFNRSGATVPIGGWSVQYASSTGSSWQVTAIPDGVELQPGQYYLIREAAGSGGSVDVPSDIQAGIPMAGGAGKVALVSAKTALTGTNPSSATLVDLVGYGAANAFEGGGPTAGLSNATSASRKNEGCQDTDSNTGDFTVGTVTPRKSDSAFKACGPVAPTAAPIVASCPAAILRPYGDSASGPLSAIDKDSRVTGAAITSSAVTGIRLENFSASSAINAPASVNLVADASVAPGNHAVIVNFTNDANQSMSCTVTVRSSGNLAIPVIQGAGATSPYANTIQTTEGVITAKVGSGYFIQDAGGDQDPTTSDAIFVYGSTSGAVGDLVRVTGLVTEYTPSGAASSYTELTNTTSSVIGAGPFIGATNITLPSASLEPFEGMLVRITSPLTVNQNAYVGARGELTLSSGRREIPTNRHRPGTPEALALAAANANNEIVLDDGLFVTPTTIPYIGEDDTVRTGDTVTDLEGVLDFGAFGGGGAGFKLQPTVPPVFSRTNPRSGAPVLPAGIKVASANVLNFFTTFVDGSNVDGATGQGCTIGSTTRASNCRGANNMIEFVRQRDKIVKSLVALNADVVGLMEIQNNGDTAVSYLVGSLNAALGGPVYAVVPKPPATGTDAIRVAMIYKPAVVTLAGVAMSDGDDVNNRPPMAQTFKARNNGAKFSVIVNHLKAKAGCPTGNGPDSDRGDGQSCWNATRVEQAQRLATVFIPQVKAAAGDEDVLVIGDMNAYGFEDPIAYLTGNGLDNQLERFVRPHGMAYSYVFGGESGYLDHALTTSSLSAQVAGAAEWHNNADEPEAIDYNLEGKPQDLYANNAYRASDHDPVLVSLNLTPVFADVTASVKLLQSGLTMNRATLKYTGKVTFTNTGAAPLAGPLHFVLENLSAGVSLDGASGTHNGASYITLPGGLAPGASVTVTTTFSNPSKSAIGYTPKLFSGTI